MGKWVKKKLGDLGFSFSGLSGKTIDDFGEGKPFIPYMNIFTNGKINSKQLEYVRIAENERQNKVEQGDWFFTTSSETPDEVGMTSVLVEDIGEAYLNSFCFGFRLYDKSEFEPEFVSYLFRSLELRKKISLFAQGSTRYNLPKQQMFEKLYISYPSSLSEQRRIASILSSADKVIDSTKKLIAKYKQIKQGMMEDLLKPKEGWKKVKFGEVINDSYAGGTPNRSRGDYFGGGISWVTSGEVNNPEICSTLENITIEGLNNSSAKWIPENSILVALYGATAGQVSMLRIKATSNQAVLAVIPNAEFTDTMFLFYQIVYNKDNLLYLAQGSGQPNLSKNLVDRLEISIPDLSEQRRIASILSGIDKKIESEEKALEKYKKIKKGLMEKLLRGE